MSDRVTFPQARGRLVSTLLREYGRTDMIVILWRLGDRRVIGPSDTPRQLAHRIAWRLLPGGERVTSSAAPALDPNAVLGGTDSRTGAP